MKKPNTKKCSNCGSYHAKYFPEDKSLEGYSKRQCVKCKMIVYEGNK